MSVNDVYPSRSNIPEDFRFNIFMLGANGAAPTVQEGLGTTVARTGEGAYTITFPTGFSPGNFVGFDFGFVAATPADLAGYTVVCDTYNESTGVLAFVVYNSSFAAADIIADQYLSLGLKFRRSNVQ